MNVAGIGMTKAVVGLIGAGRMGLPIVGHLVRAGFVVVVRDIDGAAAGGGGNGALVNWGKQTVAWAHDDMEIVKEMAYDGGNCAAAGSRGSGHLP
jgi:hypothetical protein